MEGKLSGEWRAAYQERKRRQGALAEIQEDSFIEAPKNLVGLARKDARLSGRLHLSWYIPAGNRDIQSPPVPVVDGNAGLRAYLAGMRRLQGLHTGDPEQGRISAIGKPGAIRTIFAS